MRPTEQDLARIDAACGGTLAADAREGALLVAEGPWGAAYAAYDLRGLRYRWARPWLVRPEAAVVAPPRGPSPAVGHALAALALRTLRRAGRRLGVFGAPSPAAAGALRDAFDGRLEGVASAPPPPRTTMLASGGGTNVQAVIDAAGAGRLGLDLRAVVANKAGAPVLERARRAGIPDSLAVWDRRATSRAAYDAALIETVARTEPELVLLLGWMHVLPEAFVARFPAILNIHPAYLPFDPARDEVVVPDGTSIPAFRGPHAIADALAAGSGWYGASAHRVGVDVDRGEILARRPLPLRAADTDGALAALRATEHEVLLTAIARWLAER